MRAECWALRNRNNGLHRSIDYEFYEPILPQLFRTRKQALAYANSNAFFRNHEPVKVILRIEMM